jgi:methylenetetrahydrofolate reductase (NADPH)
LRLPTLRRQALDDAGRAALARVLADPTLEILPLKNAAEQITYLPAGATVSVTASPAKGLDATVELAAQLQAAGFRAIPHLSARMVVDEHHLRRLVARMVDAGIDRAFVVGGDATEPGQFPDGLALLEARSDLDIAPREIGIPCYPQGHPSIPDAAVLSALAAKSTYASYMTTQLCFDPKAIETWLAARREEGIELPVKIGIPGVAEIPKLVSISARIGVRDASRFILKNTRFVGQLLTSGGVYRPSGLLEKLAPLIADPAADVLGLHVYTFNNVGPTVAWRDELVAKRGET